VHANARRRSFWARALGPGGHLGLQRLVLLSLRKAEWVQNPLKGKWIFLDAWPGSAPASIEP